MKKKVNRKSSKKNKFEYKQFLIGAFVFLLLVFLLGFVHVGPSASASVTGNAIFGSGSGAGDFINNLFTSWQSGGPGGLDINIAKYMLFFILSLLIFSVFRMANFPPGGGLQFILALLVSFLAIAYITPDELYVVISTYTSMGVVLSMIVPFFILCLFTTSLVSPIKIKGGKTVTHAVSLPQVLLSILMWLMFCGYSTWRLFQGFFIDKTLHLPALPAIVMLAGTFIAFCLLFFHKKFMIGIAKIAGGILQSEAVANAAVVKAGRVTVP